MIEPIGGTLPERILHTLRVSRRSWDDDQLTAHLSVSHRQAVNQACNRLAAGGKIHRYVGDGGKLVNSLVESQNADTLVTRAVIAPNGDLSEAAPPGSSAEQRAAEGVMIAYVADKLGLELRPQRIVTATGARVEVDGADDACTVLVEAWAHQGPPKVAQKHKVLADAFKLVWIASTLPIRPQLILCFSDEAAAKPFRGGRSWATAALRDQRIEVFVAELPEQVRADILAAQRRQYR